MSSQSKSKSSRSKLKKELDVLHRELEIAEYAKVGHGQGRKRTPRREMRERSRKRKLLEKDDYVPTLQEDEDRLRGSKAALGEDLVHDSLVLRRDEEEQEEDEELSDEEDEEESSGDEEGGDEDEEGGDEEGGEFDHDPEVDEVIDDEDDEIDDIEEGEHEDNEIEQDELGDDEIEQDEHEDDEIEQDELDGEEIDQVEDAPSKKKAKKTNTKPRSKSKSKKVKTVRKSIKRKTRKRTLYRMRNFKSFRMAERHGDALGAHARGLPLLAIQKLQQVAADAPTAPQVYTSLGMVYEDMLNQEDENNWKERLELAKKAYGSYHVAAVLCKKDYMVWVRAADTAREVSDLYSFAMQQEDPEQHRPDKLRWVQEAQKDYQTADNLKPPGLDVPAKLAAAHVELGNLSEALSILTDLKKRPGQTHKTWMLYADLMLRIGFECQQWNQGTEANQNYMFRRWLRKYSRLFDWQERRLQALALALEAAAGSTSCRKLTQWTVKRAKEKSKQSAEEEEAVDDSGRWHMDDYETQPKDDTETETQPKDDTEIETQPKDDKETETQPKDDKETETQPKDDTETETQPKDDTETEEPTETEELADTANREDSQEETALDDQGKNDQLTLDTARSVLLSQKKAELEAFDEETKSSGSPRRAKQRLEERAEIVKRHRQALVELVGASLDPQKYAAMDESRAADLPISASCSTVCIIASELIKHCLGLEQFEGGRLVAESVSMYLRERASMRENRVKSTLAFEKKQQSTASDILLNRETYDEIEEEDSSDDDDDEPPEYLSDEEIMESNPALVDHFCRGVLPPELQVLFALSLIGEGGKDFLASKCIDAMAELKDDTPNYIEQKVADTDAICYPAWQVYHQAMTDQLPTIPALAFIADMLKKVKKEKEWARKIGPMFQSAMKSIESTGLLDQALDAEKSKNPNTILRRTHVLKIVLAGARFRVLQCELQLLSTNDPNRDVAACFEEVESVMCRLWNGEDGRLPSKSSVEALQIVVQLLRLLERAGIDQQVVLNRLRTLVGLLVGFKSDDIKAPEADPEWSSLPFSSSWQNEKLRSLSLRMHNLCVANSVALFAGWEDTEFSLDLMQRKGKNKYFGITLNEGRVIGHLLADSARHLADAWLVAESVVGVKIDFVARLDKATTFLEKGNHVAPPPKGGGDVAIYGEKDALTIFIKYAQQCFVVASTLEVSSATRNELIETGMSLLLPITQFSVLVRVWDSQIGQATGSLSGLDEWRGLAARLPLARPTESTTPRPLRKQQRRSIDQWHQADLSLVARIVVIPIKFIVEEWTSKESEAPPGTSSDKEEHQTKLHDTMRQLRMCSTEHTLQKASLQVTLALLDLLPLVFNPFLVMQQAAMFASQCMKGGNMDVNFKTELPPEEECSPMDALVILARADCLQAVHFSQEATYLCSFVARCCQLHRDRLQDGAEWTSKWKVIGICAYNISMATRSTICTTQFDKESQMKALEVWDDEVLGELERCRSDAIAMRRATVGEEDIEDTEHDDEDAESNRGASNVESLGIDEQDVIGDENRRASNGESLGIDEQDATGDDMEDTVDESYQGGDDMEDTVGESYQGGDGMEDTVDESYQGGDGMEDTVDESYQGGDGMEDTVDESDQDTSYYLEDAQEVVAV